MENKNNYIHQKDNIIPRAEDSLTGIYSDKAEAEEFEMLVQAYLRDSYYTTSTQAAFNLIYSILVLPFVANAAGIPLFIVTVAVISLVSGYTNCMLIEMAEDQGVRTLEDLGDRTFGPKGYYFVCLLQLVFSLTLMLISLSIWGDIMLDVLSNASNHTSGSHPALSYILGSRGLLCLFGGLLILPMCFVRSLSTLSYNTIMAVVVLACGVVFVISSFSASVASGAEFNVGDIAGVNRYAWMVQLMVSFCFSYQQKLFSVYNCLRRRSVSRWRPAVVKSHSVIVTLYLIFGIFGALSFKSNINDSDLNFNFFAMYGQSHGSRVVFNIARILIAGSLLLTIPVDCVVTVTTWRRLVARYRRYERSTPANSPGRNNTLVHDDDDEEGCGCTEMFSIIMRSSDESDQSNATGATILSGSDTNPDRAAAAGAAMRSQNGYAPPSEQLTRPGAYDEPHGDPYGQKNSLHQRKADQTQMTEEVTVILHETEEGSTRSNSVGLILDSDVANASVFDRAVDKLSVFLVWIFVLILSCVMKNSWDELAALVGTLVSSYMVFILPSAIYFRIGVKSDYSSIPILGFLPNRIAMFNIQIAGILCFFTNIICIVYYRLAKQETYLK